MNGADNISGFIEGMPASESAQFTHIEQMYVSQDGYTCLYKCERLGKLHVLKALQPDYIGKDFYEKALRKEFNMGFQLDHPHICRTLSWEYVEGLGHCIVMDYIDGVPLSSVMESGRFKPDLAQKIITELCAALEYLHKKQIVHRDLKPSNILITHNGDNAIADSAAEGRKWGGLSPFGKQVVAEMNALGMMIDLSHASDKTFWDCIKLSQAPVVATHSCCRALCGHRRNLTDEMLQALGEKGGYVGINFCPAFLSLK